MTDKLKGFKANQEKIEDVIAPAIYRFQAAKKYNSSYYRRLYNDKVEKELHHRMLKYPKWVHLALKELTKEFSAESNTDYRMNTVQGLILHAISKTYGIKE